MAWKTFTVYCSYLKIEESPTDTVLKSFLPRIIAAVCLRQRFAETSGKFLCSHSKVCETKTRKSLKLHWLDSRWGINCIVYTLFQLKLEFMDFLYRNALLRTFIINSNVHNVLKCETNINDYNDSLEIQERTIYIHTR